MKKTILPRLFAVLTAAVISISLLDSVATMGQHPDTALVSVALVPVGSDQALSGI